mgnify:CR=1 FL=1
MLVCQSVCQAGRCQLVVSVSVSLCLLAPTWRPTVFVGGIWSFVLRPPSSVLCLASFTFLLVTFYVLWLSLLSQLVLRTVLHHKLLCRPRRLAMLALKGAALFVHPPCTLLVWVCVRFVWGRYACCSNRPVCGYQRTQTTAGERETQRRSGYDGVRNAAEDVRRWCGDNEESKGEKGGVKY